MFWFFGLLLCKLHSHMTTLIENIITQFHCTSIMTICFWFFAIECVGTRITDAVIFIWNSWNIELITCKEKTWHFFLRYSSNWNRNRCSPIPSLFENTANLVNKLECQLMAHTFRIFTGSNWSNVCIVFV